jgi:hypothetical protein
MPVAVVGGIYRTLPCPVDVPEHYIINIEKEDDSLPLVDKQARCF